MLLPLLTAPFISRALGADALGIYSYSSTMAAYFGLFGMLGVKNYGNREISRHRDAADLGSWFWCIYAIQLIASAAMLLLYGALDIIFAFKAAKDAPRGKLLVLLCLPFLFPVVHIVYGAGTLCGLLSGKAENHA